VIDVDAINTRPGPIAVRFTGGGKRFGELGHSCQCAKCPVLRQLAIGTLSETLNFTRAGGSAIVTQVDAFGCIRELERRAVCEFARGLSQSVMVTPDGQGSIVRARTRSMLSRALTIS